MVDRFDEALAVLVAKKTDLQRDMLEYEKNRNNWATRYDKAYLEHIDISHAIDALTEVRERISCG